MRLASFCGESPPASSPRCQAGLLRSTAAQQNAQSDARLPTCRHCQTGNWDSAKLQTFRVSERPHYSEHMLLPAAGRHQGAAAEGVPAGGGGAGGGMHAARAAVPPLCSRSLPVRINECPFIRAHSLSTGVSASTFVLRAKPDNPAAAGVSTYWHLHACRQPVQQIDCRQAKSTGCT